MNALVWIVAILRAVLRTTAVLSILVVLLVVVTGAMLGTDNGSRVLWNFAAERLPQGVSVAEVSGRFSGPLRLRKLSIDRPEIKLTLESVDLDWQPLTLFSRILLINYLRIEGLDYHQPPAQEQTTTEAGPMQLPASLELPLNIKVDELRAKRLRLLQPDEQLAFEITELQARAVLDNQGWRLREFSASGPDFGATARLRVLPKQPYAVEGKFAADLKLKELPRYSANAVIGGDSRRLQLDMDIQQTGAQARATLAGDISVTADPGLELTLDWEHLQWPLQGKPQYQSRSGKFRIGGTLSAYQLDGGLRWLLADQAQSGVLAVRGSGDSQHFELAEFALSGAPGELQGQGNIVWAPQLKADIAVTGEKFNPGALVAGWPGALDLNVKAAVREGAAGISVDVSTLRIKGSLQEQPVDLNAVLNHTPTKTLIKKLSLVSGATTLQMQGKFADSSDLSWQLKSADIGAHTSVASGAVALQGQLLGSRSKPRILLDLNAADVRAPGMQLKTLDVKADLGASGRRPSSFVLQASDAVSGEVHLRSLTITGDGTPSEHRLNVAADTSHGTFDAAASGALNEQFDRWRYRLERGAFNPSGLAGWQLSAPVAGVISAVEQQLERMCWHSGDARLCAQASADRNIQRADFDLQQLDIAYLKSLLPAEIAVTGIIAATGKVEMRAAAGGVFAAPAGQVEVTLVDGSISGQDEDGEWVRVLQALPTVANATFSEGTLAASLDMPLTDGDVKLTAAVDAGVLALSARPVTGKLHAKLDKLGVISALVPEVSRLEGELNADVALSGSLESPKLNGELKLRAQQLMLVTPGLQVTDLAVTGRGTGDRIDLEFSATSGGGELTGGGEFVLAASGTRAALQIKGSEFQVLNNRAGIIYASPDLQVKVDEKLVSVTGAIAVPRADITPDKLPAAAGAVTVSSDQVIVTTESELPPKALQRDINARVRLVIGDPKLKVDDFAARGRNFDDVLRQLPARRVNINGFGMRAVLAGNLLVTQAPGEPALGAGELRIVAGRYKAYGQDLIIRDGRVLFAGGPVTEPALNISAVRYPETGIMAGVQVRGRVTAPELTLISEPAMTQSEQVSWLVLGRSPKGASAEEAGLLTKAALALGTKGGGFIAEKVSSRLGLDELGIDSGSNAAEAALVVGKYLTPELYVSYGIGLFEPVSTLRTRYRISPSWQFETESSPLAAGGDIIYSIETGQ